ncbi:MAG: RsmD family RNA methyltransferase [Planctomycetota bacterium]|nr:RsmD family RNA methyltransferase [Planctomycetota bacterium]MCX8040466.1 RsmD family RNA methyltransferase [Planctomycetota bacterium]MDW8373214.1 RsmD family RNA methyltransferase [Planctomycetota bacterium]
MGALRIIGGAWRGRRLLAPPGTTTRPLPDRLRQALCDWLGQDFGGALVCDAYAGSGAFGLECASRGASAVWCIERDDAALRTLRANLRRLGDPPQVRVLSLPVERALPTVRGCDLVFLDPPFALAEEELQRVLRLAADCLAGAGSALVLRREQGRPLTLPPPLQLREQRRYGRSVLLWAGLRP